MSTKKKNTIFWQGEEDVLHKYVPILRAFNLELSAINVVHTTGLT
jgi:hypothetical protein